MKGHIRLLSAALVLALAPAARAQTAGDVDTQVSAMNTTAANAGQTRVATRIASTFSSLAGSQDNSLALVEALRNGTPVTLTPPDDGTTSGTGTTTGTAGGTGTTSGGTTSGGTGTTITPPTGKMGWGEVFISLALAKAELANLGITNPTPDQLQAALTGGSITNADGTTVQVKGVLELRAQGMGWGQIAQAEGTKLGPVVSSLRSGHDRLASVSGSGKPTSSDDGDSSKRLAHASASGSGDSRRGIVTANGSSSTSTASGKGHKGIVTANGSSSTSTGGGKGHKGIVTASGTSSTLMSGGHSSHGIVSASGIAVTSGSRGIVTAGGALGASGHGHAFGRGLVTASGASASGITAASIASAGHGGATAGLVTATGASASGIATAESAAGSSGEHHGHGRGKGGG
jgi:hypothetical protein